MKCRLTEVLLPMATMPKYSEKWDVSFYILLLFVAIWLGKNQIDLLVSMWVKHIKGSKKENIYTFNGPCKVSGIEINRMSHSRCAQISGRWVRAHLNIERNKDLRWISQGGRLQLSRSFPSSTICICMKKILTIEIGRLGNSTLNLNVLWFHFRGVANYKGVITETTVIGVEAITFS